VSLLWALSPHPWARAEVLAAHDTAVEVAQSSFEFHGGVTAGGPTVSTGSTPRD